MAHRPWAPEVRRGEHRTGDELGPFVPPDALSGPSIGQHCAEVAVPGDLVPQRLRPAHDGDGEPDEQPACRAGRSPALPGDCTGAAGRWRERRRAGRRWCSEAQPPKCDGDVQAEPDEHEHSGLEQVREVGLGDEGGGEHERRDRSAPSCGGRPGQPQQRPVGHQQIDLLSGVDEGLRPDRRLQGERREHRRDGADRPQHTVGRPPHGDHGGDGDDADAHRRAPVRIDLRERREEVELQRAEVVDRRVD